MPIAEDLKLIEPKTPGLLTRDECAEYLCVGYNEVPRIMERFDVPSLGRLYSERIIWKKILRLDPQSDDAAQKLRYQLQDIGWLSRKIGESPVTIRRKIAEGTLAWAEGVQLGAVDANRAAPRLRRWPPQLILACLDGHALDDLSFLEPDLEPPATIEPDSQKITGELDAKTDGHALGAGAINAFAAVCAA